MTTVTITFTNSRNKTETGTFEVARRSELSKTERYEWIDAGAQSISSEEWSDDETATVEKQAAQAAGISTGEWFYIIQK